MRKGIAKAALFSSNSVLGLRHHPALRVGADP